MLFGLIQSKKTEQPMSDLHTIQSGQFELKNSIFDEIDNSTKTQDTVQTSKQKKFHFRSFKVNKSKQTFLDNLSLLIASGIGVNTALRTLEKNSQNKKLKIVLHSMLVDVENGQSLSQTMENHNFLPKFLISLIRIGEESGNLADKIRRTVISLDKEQRRKSQLKTALFYPVFVLSLTLILGLGVSIFVLPRIGQVFANMNVTLPWITKVLISIGDILGTYWYIIVPGIIGGLTSVILILFVFPLTKVSGQWLLFHTPVFNSLIVRTEVSRFCYNLSMLLNSGVPITHALTSLSEIHDYYMYKNFTRQLASSIQEGKSFHNSFTLNQKISKKLFPFTAQEIITAGEESGKLPEVLDQVGARYEEESEQIAKNIAVLLEPALLIVVWLGVVFLAVAILLPIYSLVGNFQV
jgi:type IV pilus assembly protein PilC